MRKSCFLLLTLLALTYIYQGYRVADDYIHDKIKIKTRGKLSDIAGHVQSIPLETPDSGAIQQAGHVRKDGNHLFLLSDNRLLHFNTHGKFINRIAGDINGETHITQYALNTEANQVIVIDDRRNISKYDYDGNRISKDPIKHPWHKLTAFAFHNGCLWATAETLAEIRDLPDSYRIRHNLYQLDPDMNILSEQTLHIADIGREWIFTGTCVSELLADEEGIYAYVPPSGTEHLLQDTLYMAEQKKLPLLYPKRHPGTACIYPVRKGARYTMSTCNNHTGRHFTFCYDHLNFTAYILPKGFKDDLFGTGYITDLQPMDMYNQSYCFIKSGNKDRPVLFIVDVNA